MYIYHTNTNKYIYIYHSRYLYHTSTYSQHTIPKDMHKITSYLSIKSYQIIISHRSIIKFSKGLYIYPSSCLCNFCKGKITTEPI